MSVSTIILLGAAALVAATPVSESRKAAIITDCAQLSSDYAYALDFADSERLSQLFAEDGVWDLGKLPPFIGRKAIKDYEDHQIASRLPGKVTRHVMSNVRIEVLDETHARGTAYLTLYSVDTTAAAPHALTPESINVFHDEYVITPGGCRYLSHKPERLRAGG